MKIWLKSFVRQKRVENNLNSPHTVSHTEKRGKLCKKPARDFSKVTVDSDDMGGEVYSVRRVSDYLSSHIDLDDRIRTDMGCTQRDDGPNDVSNHCGAPSTQIKNQVWGEKWILAVLLVFCSARRAESIELLFTLWNEDLEKLWSWYEILPSFFFWFYSRETSYQASRPVW